jgi:hypothetical protein
MTRNRRSLILGVLLALTLGVSCTAGDPTSTDLSIDPGGDPRGQLPGGMGVAYGSSGTTDLLTCKPLPYLTNTKLIGPKGGKLKVGSHVLDIPEGALSEDVSITAEQISDSSNSVRFSPEGLEFAKSAELTMSYENCTLVLLPKKIVYTTELLTILELLPSTDKFQSKIVTGRIDHFSRYAVAY